MKKLIISRTMLMGLFMFAATLTWTSVAMADMGLSGDFSKPLGQDQSFDMNGSSYITIGMSAPIEVSYDPNMGPWKKTFDEISWPFHITENVHISQGVPWTDWDEEILTDGWVWASDQNPPQVELSTQGQIIGTVIGDISADGQTVVFNFPNPMPPCTTLTITKTLRWAGGDPAPTQGLGSVTIAQYPTIPEPGTLALLLSGAAALATVAWRRRR